MTVERQDEPRRVYQAQLDQTRAQLADESARFARVGLVRLGVFVAGVVASVAAVLARGGVATWIVAGLAVGFIALVVWHERIARRRGRLARSVAYYERGVARLEHRWRDGGDDGVRFRSEAHLYADDLELFGPGSLFQYLSTAGTEGGASTLADWLLTPAPADVIRERQEAVGELAGKHELRHDLAVAAPEVREVLDASVLRPWLASPPVPFAGWIGPAAMVVAASNVVTTVLALAGQVPGIVPAVSYGVGVALALAVRDRVRRVLQSVDRPVRELRVLATLVDRARAETFTSGRLAALAASWYGGAGSAVLQIRRLERLTDLADARRNQLFAPLAALLLLGTQLGVAVERWRQRIGTGAADWRDGVGELEALVSLATFAFEQPDTSFPEIRGVGEPIEAAGLAHPLLPADRAIRNSLTLGGECRLLMVSGSNMSGKSTLLKAIGTNLVLAYAGAPVRAHRFGAGQWALGASLVLRESLLEGRSRFYAEILRLRDIVAAAEAGQRVLFLLDELLSGTNSHDRAIGAHGILHGLVDLGAAGVVTTHDLALTESAVRLGVRAQNWHLEDVLVDGQLEFDYHLKPGVVRRSNALALMKAVGLSVPNDLT